MDFREILCYRICMICPSEFKRVLINVPRQQHPPGLAHRLRENTSQGMKTSAVVLGTLDCEEKSSAPWRECTGSSEAEPRSTHYPIPD